MSSILSSSSSDTFAYSCDDEDDAFRKKYGNMAINKDQSINCDRDGDITSSDEFETEKFDDEVVIDKPLSTTRSLPDNSELKKNKHDHLQYYFKSVENFYALHADFTLEVHEIFAAKRLETENEDSFFALNDIKYLFVERNNENVDCFKKNMNASKQFQTCKRIKKIKNLTLKEQTDIKVSKTDNSSVSNKFPKKYDENIELKHQPNINEKDNRVIDGKQMVDNILPFLPILTEIKYSNKENAKEKEKKKKKSDKKKKRANLELNNDDEDKENIPPNRWLQ